MNDFNGARSYHGPQRHVWPLSIHSILQRTDGSPPPELPVRLPEASRQAAVAYIWDTKLP
ncbi:hypothetical protein GCM10007867_01000 [Gluconobacter cerinus]|uniref:Uncharacterized protein n=1 Tax=Gluconobacter cerinus TaxID=38307 RepID=A0AAV5N9P5_9PROT|nr:hypothetical protein GCM10007867_01000 [Gluconobacter cerinus]